MTEGIPDPIRRAMIAAGVDPDAVAAELAKGEVVPPDQLEVERQAYENDWLAWLIESGEEERPPPEGLLPEQLGLVSEHDLSEAERAMLRVPESTPKARTDDPATSHAAADAIRMTAQSAKASLLLAHYDDIQEGQRVGMTDEEAAWRAGLSLQSEYATRCSELRKVEPPLLTETGEERMGDARVARMVSVITAAGVLYVREHGWRP